MGKNLLDFWGVPRKINYDFKDEENKIDYIVKIKPDIKDFINECGERMYAEIELSKIVGYKHSWNLHWNKSASREEKPKLERVFLDTFLLTKEHSYEHFLWNVSCKYGFTKPLVEKMFGEQIKKLIDYKKDKRNPNLISKI